MKLNVNEVLYVLHAAIEVAFVYERELFRVLDLDL